MLRYLCLGLIFVFGCKSTSVPVEPESIQPVAVLAKPIELKNVDGPFEFSGRVEQVKGEIYKVVIDDPSFALFIRRTRDDLKKVTVSVPLAETLTFVADNKVTDDNAILFRSKREAIKFMPARVKVYSNQMRLQVVPLSALVAPNGNQTFVYQVKEGRSLRASVQTWKWQADQVILLNQIDRNLPVIYGGVHKITDKIAVEVM